MALVAITDHVFEDLEQERALLSAAGHDLRFEGNATSADEVRERVSGADAVLNCYAPMPAEVISALEGCRVIARYGIGLDTIDVGAATERGILVTNVPDYCIDEVSDHALALILSLARGIVRLDRSVRSGRWSLGDAPAIHRLRGRTLGLIGFGRISRMLATKASALGLIVVTTDPFVSDDEIEAAGAEPCSLERLLQVSDIVSIHAPLTTESRHLIGAEQLSMMREGAILVNAARGPLVDVQALRDAMGADRLGGAGLDVLETEPPPPDDALLHHPNVVVTPHAGFFSAESVRELQRKATEQVLAALAGEIPPYAVNAGDLHRTT